MARISIIQISATWTPNAKSIESLFPGIGPHLVVTPGGRMKLSSQLEFNPNRPSSYSEAQAIATDFEDLLHGAGQLHDFNQRITTVAELDRPPVAPPAYTAGDDALAAAE